MRLVFICNHFFLKAGLERILSDRMNILAEQCGYDVAFIVLHQAGKEHAYPLSSKIEFIDLGFEGYKAYRYSFIKRQWMKHSYLKKESQQLQNCINQIKPDIISTVTSFSVEFLFKLRTSAKIIIESHDDRKSMIELLSDQCSSFRFIHKWAIKRKFKKMQSFCNAIICLTQKDEKQWLQFGTNVHRIPNFTNFINTNNSINSISKPHKIILAVGRLDPQKGFDLLIKAWQEVNMRHPDWVLHIVSGTGSPTPYETLIKDLCLQSAIQIFPPTNNIQQHYTNADMLVLSSRHEGFGLVLVEALSSSLPCIAFDCPCGPSEIIQHERNGLLVPNGNISVLSQAICRMIEDDNLRNYCASNARMSVQRFSKDEIMPKWVNLYQSLVHK